MVAITRTQRNKSSFAVLNIVLFCLHEEENRSLLIINKARPGNHVAEGGESPRRRSQVQRKQQLILHKKRRNNESHKITRGMLKMKARDTKVSKSFKQIPAKSFNVPPDENAFFVFQGKKVMNRYSYCVSGRLVFCLIFPILWLHQKDIKTH